MSLPGWLNVKLLVGLCLLFTCSLAGAAIQLLQTRLVYPAGESGVSLVIKNSDVTHPVYINSWVESDRSDITITPSPVIIKPGGKGVLNIHIPESGRYDYKEGLYWLNVKGTPLTRSLLPAPLAISVINRIKVFYRPGRLFDKARDAYKEINVNACGKQLIIKNPTPYYINFYSFKIDKQEVTDISMLGPYETYSVPRPAGQHPRAKWQAILDTGFHSPFIAKQINMGC